ncbi:hypothetical protein V8F20_007546 [Naviculisporaceae sp. PSN 640]
MDITMITYSLTTASRFLLDRIGSSGSSINAVSPPLEYAANEEDKIPFAPDGKDPVLSSFGSAMKVVPRSPDSRFADVKLAVRKTIRVMPGMCASSPEDVENDKAKLREAAAVLSRARHHHLLRVLMTYFYNGPNGVQFSIIMDYAQHNLRTYLNMPSTSSLSTRTQAMATPADAPLARWFGCLISVVAYLHKRGIRHGDIKPESILVKDGTTVLLTNFDIVELNAWKTQKKVGRRKTMAAGYYYSAPEVEERGPDAVPPGRATDVFSLGVVFLEMLLAYHNQHRPIQHKRDTEKVGDSSTWGRNSFTDLQSALRCVPRHNGNSNPYLSSIDAISRWLAGIKTQDDVLPLILPAPESSPSSASAREHGSTWEPRMFSICQDMLDPEPNARPLADELLQNWRELQAAEKLDSSLLRCDECDREFEDQKRDEESAAAVVLRPLSTTGNADAAKNLKVLKAWNSVAPSVGTVFIMNEQTDDAEEPALLLAAGNGYAYLINRLLFAGESVNRQNLEGWTALHYAARRNRKDVVKLLLDKDETQVDLADHTGWTALHFAARSGHDEVVDMLLKKKANARLADKRGNTAIHFAARGGHERVVQILLSTLREADVNVTTKKGRGVLWFAALGNHRRVLSKLLESEKVDIRTLVT